MYLRKAFIAVFTLATFIGCNTAESQKKDDPSTAKETINKPIKLKEAAIKGQFYEGEQLKEKLQSIVEKSDMDSFVKSHLINETVYTHTAYKKIDDRYGLKSIPDCFLFTDINNDGVEDLIFQSNGPFITDSYAFYFFLSQPKGYKLIGAAGQINDLAIVQEYASRSFGDKMRYLKVEYYSYGCCDNPWDDKFTALVSIGDGDERLRTIAQQSYNFGGELKK